MYILWTIVIAILFVISVIFKIRQSKKDRSKQKWNADLDELIKIFQNQKKK